MLFRSFHVGPIERGEKDQSRRIWKRCIVKVGHCYPIQVDYRTKARGYIRVTAVRQERLGDITEADAKREGGYTVSSFRELWCGIRGPDAWNPQQMVYVVEFVYVGRTKLAPLDVSAPTMAVA